MAEIYIDSLPANYGFVDIVSAKIDSSKGFSPVFFSWLNLELDIIAGDVMDITETSVTLRAFIPSLGVFADAVVWFEYWEENNPSNRWITPFITINEIGWVYQNITGLTPVTNYRYKAYIQGDSITLVESLEVPFSTAGVWDLSFEENSISSDIVFNEFMFEYPESGTFYDTTRLWDVHSIKEEESASLTGKEEKYFAFDYSEQARTQDKYFMIFESDYEEKTVTDENQLYKKEEPEHWLIAEPLNKNWHFSSDTNADNIADNWEYENLDIEKCNISWYFTKPSVQKIKFLNDGKIWTELKGEGKFALYMEFGCTGDVRFRIYDKDTLETYYQKKYIAREFTVEKLQFNTNCDLVFEFSGSNVEIYLDNFVIIPQEIRNKFHKHLLTGFTVFSYNISGDYLKEGLKRYYEEFKTVSKEFTLEWDWLTKKQLEYVKTLKDKIIFVYTPLDEIFAFYVEGFNIIDKRVLPNQEWEQKYKVSMLVREV